MSPVRLELMVGEAQVLRQLIDVAVRGRGMEVAQVACVLDQKIAAAIAAAKEDAKADDAGV
jgi:hypothetical protein